MKNEEIMEEKKPKFKAQDPFVEVNIGTEEKPRMTKASVYY